MSTIPKKMGRPKKVKRGRKVGIDKGNIAFKKPRMDLNEITEDFNVQKIVQNVLMPTKDPSLGSSLELTNQITEDFTMREISVQNVLLASQDPSLRSTLEQTNSNINSQCLEELAPRCLNNIFSKNVILLSAVDSSGSTTTTSPDKETDAVVPIQTCNKLAEKSAAPQGAAPTQAPVTTDEPGIVCIASGTRHQGQLAGGGNSQCVVMSSCGFAFSVAKGQAITTADIDTILKDGNKIYINSILCGAEPRFIEPEELKSPLDIGNYRVYVTEPSWVTNLLYPQNIFELNEKIAELESQLNAIFTNDEYQNDGFLFTGQSATVSFWRHSENLYYLFNSHAVDDTGVYNRQTKFNRARLFKVSGLHNLAILLLKNSACDNVVREYSIHNIKVVDFVARNEQPLPTTYEQHLDEKLTTLQPIVLLEKLPENEKKTKLGRPKKIKRGAPKQKENAHLDAATKYNALHPVKNRETSSRFNLTNPEVHREAVAVYANKKPEVNRAAVASYAKKKPEVNRAAVASYAKKKPEVNRAAVVSYAKKKPEVNSAAVARYKATHSDTIRTSNVVYNKNVRGVAPELRQTGLIGQKSSDELNAITPYTLKKSRLAANDTFHCPHCNAKLFEEERGRKQWCCRSGRNNILHLPPIDEEFYKKQQFVKYARPYNNLFAFSALGVSHGFHHPETGLAFIKIQGRTYHRVFDLSYAQSTNPIGLYIDDGEERKRLAENLHLCQDILQEINDYIRRVNPFIACFKRLSEEPSEEANIVFEKTTRRSHGNVLGDMPRGTEIAAIINTEREAYIPKSICIWKIGDSKPHTVDVFNPLYEALQYPLLYPHGGSGWSVDTNDNNNQKLSQVKYYRCLLLSEPRFWQLGRLSEEWLVDMHCRTLEERLRFHANAQKRDPAQALRCGPLEELQNLRQIAQDETVLGEGGIIPGRIYLPNTFTGSPRYMKCKYMDGIALVNRIGMPSYLLTFTCNPKWPEIVQNTPPSATQPPAALCARVFQLKFAELLRDLRSGTWFGKCEYILYVVEFQKRGLPHTHVAFRVQDAPVQNVEIDKVIRADIPPAHEVDGKLQTAVLKHMIHGPCGPNHRTDLPCWDREKSKCNKRFPKIATDTTFVDERGFVILKRDATNTGTITYKNRQITVNDQWVVPYNAALLLKYDCHINLEVASTRKIVKYLFTYMTKGQDETRVAIVPEEIRNNEIEQYATKRYIGACDAAWRTFEFDITSREPNVKQLTVHLEGQNTVFFRHGQESGAIEGAMSDLQKYFSRPSGAEFDRLTYQDFYENYIIHPTEPKTKNVTIHPICNGRYFVTKRQRNEMVARLFWVAINRGEQFYLRMLLATFPCRSYADLYALGGPDCTTFQDAARAVGIANDEEEHERSLQEAATFYTGRRMRHFFVLLITNGAPGSILWEKFKHLLCEDILERQPHDEENAYTRGLIEIDRLLRKHGSCVQDHGLPAVEDDTTELGRERLEYGGGRLLDYVEHWLPLLSREQRHVFDHVQNVLTHPSRDASNALFLDGPSGTGKTLLLNVIVANVRGRLNGVALCTASSGIAAQNYEGGCTAHSMFRLPIDIVDDTSYWNLTNGTQRAALIRESSLIVYDEAPMAHKYLIHILERSLRDLMNSTQPFGGKVIIFAGDFRQIPPVVPGARCHNDIVQASLRTSPIWQSMTQFSLSEAQRTRDDEGYSDFLMALGSGTCESHTFGTGRNAQSLVSVEHLNVVTEIDDLLDFVFPDNIIDDPDTCASRAILCTLNANVKEINAHILERVTGDIVHCYSVDYVDEEHAHDFHLGPDTLNRVQTAGVPDYDLTIKKGCVCMIMRNLSFVDRLVNGTKVIVVDVTPRLITVRKPSESETYLIPRISFKAPVAPGSPIEMCRRQFPLQVCYAMTVHKSQGQTIDCAGYDLRSSPFSHGQNYVALGRVRNKDNIRILINRNQFIHGIPYMNNVVIRELIN